jgi:hypothetical protein
MNMTIDGRKYRIKERKQVHGSWFWAEESVTLFGVHLFWTQITSEWIDKETAIMRLENNIGRKVEIIHEIK